MGLNTLENFVVISANILALSAAIGLMFGVLAQPRRERVNWLFALLLGIMAFWAYASLMLRIPGASLFQEQIYGLYAYLSALGMLPLAFYFAVINFSDYRTTITRPLSLVAFPASLILVILLWSGNLVSVDYTLLTPEADFATYLDAYTPHFAGYAALAFALLYLLAAYLHLRADPNEEVKPLITPALLLVIGYMTDLVPVLSHLPIDTVLATVAAVRIGYTVINRQVFSPMNKINDDLTIANRILREKMNELAAAKEQTEQLNEELRAASQYKSDFLANMSHELRTPLNSIVGYSELLLQGLYGELGEKQNDRLNKIHRNGRNLLALINDILDLSKIESGRLEIVPETVDITEYIREAATTLAPDAEKKALYLKLDLPTAVYSLYADPLRTRQILNNLLSNAIKFTREGGVTVRVRNVEVKNGISAEYELPIRGWLRDGSWVLIAVQDTGIGIPPEEHANIFDEFRQVDGTTTREFGGTGLGLAITKKLVEMHNGQVWLNSAAGEGSTFFVALPSSGALIGDAPLTPESTSTTAAHILIIDDSQDAREILGSTLREAGYRVSEATSGATGLQLAVDLKPDVITLDVLMPDMNGWEVIDRLKANPATAAIPVIIVSIVNDQPRSLEVGAAAHISKPVNRRMLLATIKRIRHPEPDTPILIVEDNPDDRDIISEILRAAGYPFEICTGGQQAVDWLRQRRASLVLLDLMMPGVSGFDVLAFIHSKPALRDIPVLVVSAKELTPEEEDRLRGRIAAIVKKQDMAHTDLLARIQATLAAPAMSADTSS